MGLAPAPERSAEPEGRRRGFFSRLRENLGRSSRALAQGLNELAFDPSDDDVWERLEELLIAADVGVPATVEIVQALEAESAAGSLRTPEELREALQRIVAAKLSQPLERRALDLRNEPAVILVVGVNGTGKTTTIGKLAYQLHEAGASVVIGAARHVPRRRLGAARDLGRARAGRLRRLGERLGSRRRRVRRRQRGHRARPARRDRRHRGAPAHAGAPHGGALQGAPRDRAAAAGRAPRDAAHDRLDDRPERAPAGAHVHAGGRGHAASC